MSAWSASEARDRSRAQPIVLVEIQTLNGGPLLRLADRNVMIGGVQYADYVQAITGAGDTLDRGTAIFQNSNVQMTFKNDPWDAFQFLSDLSEAYPFEGAPVTVLVTYLDDDGTPATPEVIFVGNLDSPGGITTASLTCTANCREAFASIANR
jgi:hypothetical protein